MRRLRQGWRNAPFSAKVGVAIIVLLLLVAAAAPWLAPYDPEQRTGAPFGRPDGEHWLGTDHVGHDLLSQIIWGARPSLIVGLVAALVATFIGAVVGVVAGYLRGVVDAVLMRIVDVVMSLPVVPLTLVVGVALGAGMRTQILVIALALWAPLARELRAQVLSLRERDFIQGLRAMGASNVHVLRHHVVPSVATLVAPQLVIAIKTAILLEASLSFLGLGDVNTMSWGMILSIASERSAFLTDAWLWWVVPPGALIGLAILGFALAGGLVERTSGGAVPKVRRRVRRIPRPRVSVEQAGATERDLADALLVVDDLTIRYRSADGVGGGCTGVSFVLPRGGVLGLVGESGSGKSTVAAAVAGLMAPTAEVLSGRVLLEGRDLLDCTPAERRALLGARIGLVPQEAQAALNPVRRIGRQLTEAVHAHQKVSRTQALARAEELLLMVGLTTDRLRSFPHQLSGGQRQRVVMAMALANDPVLLVADEPTSGLDVLVQEEILGLLQGLRQRLDLSILLVTHDLPVVAEIADRVAVMRDGVVVESGATVAVLDDPQHDYTRTLVASLPDLSDFGDLETVGQREAVAR